MKFVIEDEKNLSPEDIQEIYEMLDKIEVVSLTTVQRLFKVSYIFADKIIRNLLINGAIRQEGMFYKIISKDLFVNICEILGVKISPLCYPFYKLDK